MMSMSPITAAKRMAYNLWPQARRAITSLQPVVPVEGLGTLAVDKHWRLYYDPEYVSGDNFKEPGITILHELLHLLWGHCGRGENMLGQNPSPQAQRVWNIVCDLKVNRALRVEELPVPDEWVDREYVNAMCAQLGSTNAMGKTISITPDIEARWSVERIFNLIMQRIKHEQAESGNQGGNDGVHGEAEQSGGLSGGEQHHEGEAGHEASGRGDSAGGTPEETDRVVPRDGQPDQRGEGGDEGDCPEGGHSHSGPVGSSGRRADPGRGLAGSCADGQTRDWELPAPENGGPGLKPFDLQPIVRDVANSIASTRSGSWGHEPGSVSAWAEGYINPQIDPYTALMRYVLRTVADSSGGNRQTYTRPNRRRRTSGLLLPGKRAHKPRITICVDTSGSMEDSDIGLAVGLINRVLNRFQVRSGIRVITGDTEGKTSTVVNRKLDRLLTAGGGGTDMRPLIDEALSTTPKPQLVLVVTDGGTPWPEGSKGVPVVACITRSEPDNDIPDWMGTFCMVK